MRQIRKVKDLTGYHLKAHDGEICGRLSFLFFLRLEFSPTDVYWSFVDNQETLLWLAQGLDT